MELERKPQLPYESCTSSSEKAHQIENEYKDQERGDAKTLRDGHMREFCGGGRNDLTEK